MDALRIPLVLLAAAALALSSGCSTSNSGSAGSPTPSPTSTLPEGFGYGPATSPDVDAVPAVLIGGLATDTPPWGEGTDGVVLAFSPGPPVCDVRYVDPPITDEQTGATVEVAGTAFLRVQCREVTEVALAEPTGDPPGRFDTTPGSDRFSGSAKTVTEVVQTGYDGSTLTWTIGLRNRTPFGVGLLGSGTSEEAQPPPPAPAVMILIVR